jgi:hypothetical protein
LKTPGWYRYLFPAHLFVLILFPVILYKITDQLKKKSFQKIATIIIILLIFIQAIHLLNGRNTKLYHNPVPRQFAMDLLNIVDKNASVFIVDHPELWFLYDNIQAKQYMQMNPYIAFGEDVFTNKDLPDYIISGEPDQNLYLTVNMNNLLNNYNRIDQRGSYILFKRK